MNENSSAIAGSDGLYRFAKAEAVIPLAIYGEGNKELIKIGPTGTVHWNGREVETDAEFRAAMLDLVKLLTANMGWFAGRAWLAADAEPAPSAVAAQPIPKE